MYVNVQNSSQREDLSFQEGVVFATEYGYIVMVWGSWTEEIPFMYLIVKSRSKKSMIGPAVIWLQYFLITYKIILAVVNINLSQQIEHSSNTLF